MIIIGITGGIGHGKSTLAEALARAEPRSRHFETYEIIAEVVDAWHAQTERVPNPHKIAEVNEWLALLPPLVYETLHQKIEPAALQLDLNVINTYPEVYEKLFAHLQRLQENPGLLRERIGPENKANYRAILQWLGGYLVLKVDPGIWYQAIMRRVQAAAREGVVLCTIGGVRYPSDAEIVRQSGGRIVQITRPFVRDQDMSDPTERERIKIKPDITVSNDAGIVELARCAYKIYADLQLGKLQAKYIASQIR